jgi:hypothetical protein
MATSSIIEAESGTCAGKHRQHNGNHADDFIAVPLHAQPIGRADGALPRSGTAAAPQLTRHLVPRHHGAHR